MIHHGITNPNRKTYIHVNNCPQGNALATIEAMVSGDGCGLRRLGMMERR